MINQDYFRNKEITVVGLARSGLACANLLYSVGARVSVTENKNSTQVKDYALKLHPSVRRELGGHSREFIQERDLIVTSPGVEYSSQVLAWARELGIPVISEIECAWILCPASVIATTGTNGKTTTTTLIAEVLKASGRNAFALGNIGTPFSAQVNQIESRDFVSLEVSSFQLETIKSFKPKIAVILNFTPDHLDRYPDMSSYLAAKSRIFMNQDNRDYLVLNYDFPILRRLAGKSNARIVYFNQKMHFNPNFSAVIAVASILGIEQSLCEDVFHSFRGLPHRLERVAEFQQREFINYSKATNPGSTVFALNNIQKPVILIAGGRDKGFDYNLIRDLVCSKTKLLILIGEAKDKIKQAFQDKLPLKEVYDLKEASEAAFMGSKPGDCILFSPMCSSFDMFRDYQHRGEVFKEAVLELIKKKIRVS
ncbi:MAG: UDP-N-acetylmuramoyl-L-alanine--D-glutamate ligase [Candidatus Omnitrophica bacterium]|nr:UDP-N-acetylmuramoyl-L-alanine--D-glutamate ligase [Candidatus Omnitrophota bacterium]